MVCLVVYSDACKCIDIGQDTCGDGLFFFVAPPRREDHERVVPTGDCCCGDCKHRRKQVNASYGKGNDVDSTVEQTGWVTQECRTFCCRVTDDALGVYDDPASAVSQNVFVVKVTMECDVCCWSMEPLKEGNRRIDMQQTDPFYGGRVGLREGCQHRSLCPYGGERNVALVG